MKEGEELWKKYCSFFEKDFSEQLEYNEKKKEEYFKKWKNTKMAKQLCPKGVEKFEDVPLTTYEDYPILHEFGTKMNQLVETVPRGRGEPWYDYYNRIGKQVAPMLEGWLPEEYSLSISTGGTTGVPKWIPHGNTCKENNLLTNTCRGVILACSEHLGETNIKPGDNILNMVAPVPYGSGYAWKCLESEFNLVPPIEVTDNISTMRKKVGITLKTLKKKRVHWLGGMGSFLKLLYEYFMEPQKLYREYYLSMKPGPMRFILYLMWLKSRVGGKRYEDIREILPLKGLAFFGVGAEFYRDFIKDAYSVEPLIGYATSEGLAMIGLPDRKMDFHPILDGTYFEFLDRDGEIKKIDELKKEEVYEVIGTTFNSILIRHRIDDLLKVIDIRDDGMPVFKFESRKGDILDIYGWFRITTAMATKTLSHAGLRLSDSWAITKDLGAKERLLLLMERDWDYSEEEACKKLVDVLSKLNPEFQNYLHDFKIRNPSEVIEVKYLRKGAFKRYMLKMEKEGKPLGHYKPPKIVPPEKHEIAEILMEM